MNYLYIVPILLVLAGVLLYLLYQRKNARFPFPVDQILYSDSEDNPGQVFISSFIPLVGKPDYVVKIKKDIVPVEVKRGKTPRSPHANHLAQLFSYCYLIEEHYQARPKYGIICYPDEYFKVEFDKRYDESIKRTVEELLEKKQLAERKITTLRICKSCRDNHLEH